MTDQELAPEPQGWRSATIRAEELKAAQDEIDAAAATEAAEAAGETATTDTPDTPGAAETAQPQPEATVAFVQSGAPSDAASLKDAARVRRKQRARRKAGIGIAAVLAAALVGCTGWMFVDDQSRVQRVPENTTLDGFVDISGLTRSEVVDVVNKRVGLGYTAAVNVKVDDATYSFKLDEVGTVDADKTADAAFSPYLGGIFLQREVAALQASLTGADAPARDVMTVCEVDEAKVAAEVEKIAAKANRDVRDAGYEYDSKRGALKYLKPANGVKVNQKATVAAIDAALENPGSSYDIDATTKVVKPKVTDAGQAIFVDTYGCRLYLYENGKQVIDWPCSPGQAGYETPLGDWYLEYKDPSPTWYNPHVAWSADMPDVWEPGYDNPLGVRALAVSCGDGIFIHGTINLAALGSRDSHGCVRLSNENIVELYNRVNVGIPIIFR